jgi:hypothetical protein
MKRVYTALVDGFSMHLKEKKVLPVHRLVVTAITMETGACRAAHYSY